MCRWITDRITNITRFPSICKFDIYNDFFFYNVLSNCLTVAYLLNLWRWLLIEFFVYLFSVNVSVMNDIIKLDTVDAYNQLFGLETLHPLVSVVDLTDATRFPKHFIVNYGIYALFLKDTKCGDIRYGKQVYDYQDGTITSFAPGQVVETEISDDVRPKAKGLLFD